MKKLSIFFIASVCIALIGCSWQEETRDTLDYIGEAAEYIDALSIFTEQTTGLVSEAVHNTEAKAELETRLISLEKSINDFNNIEAPTIARGIHENIKMNNLQLLDILNNVMPNGEVVIQQLEESLIYQRIEVIQELVDHVELFGF